MKIIRIRALLATAGALMLGIGATVASGRLVSTDEAPVTIPSQRALILHDQGIETLVLQCQYETSGAAGDRPLGWVVPVPAPPELASLTGESAERVFRFLDTRSQPEVTRIGPVVLMVPLGVSLSVVLLGFGWSFLARNAVHRRSGKRWGRWAGVAFLGCLLLGPLIVKAPPKDSGVEILTSRTTGVFQVQVVRPQDAAGLRGWLTANSFRPGTEDEKVLQSYLDRGWCLVVAKVEPAAKDAQPAAVSRTLLAPLVLRFPSVNPIYPVALTATVGQPAELLIYLASNTPMATGSPLTRRFSGGLQPLDGLKSGPLSELGFATPPGFFDSGKRDFRYLGKFKATLTPAEMAQDIEFHPVPADPPYRERRYRW